jgi:signal transduction histidine kinase/CheY-like chemotaxis protein
MKLPAFIRRSLRAKMTAVVLATTFVALLVNALALFYYNAVTLRETQIADVRTQAEILGRASAPALAFNDRKEAGRDLAMLKARPDIEAAALYAADGTLFASYTRAGLSAEFPQRAAEPGYRLAEDRVTLVHPIVEGSETVGRVYMRASVGLRERVIYYFGILAAVMALALAAAFAVAGWLQRAVTAPILSVAALAREVVERRNFAARAPRGGEDETGALADAMNRMLADLEREMAERSQAEEALRAADRRKDEFLATLAHELRNPLAPIRNAVYIMQTRKDDPQVVADMRAMVERQVRQMVRLVDDLLDVSRITTGKLALRRERVDLRAVAESALEAVEPLARARGHKLGVELPPAGVYVSVDPTRLAQVFLNLLNNAVKFTEPEGRIEFRLELAGGELVARVRDNGIGIAAEMLEPIFDMFVQADQTLERSTSGLGVGLSLSRRLVELHGGSVTASSAGAGRGAQFVVRIPALGAEHAAAPRARAEAGAAASRHRILVVDDNRDFADSLAAMLRAMGHEVRVEHDGLAARGAAEEFRPGLAFLDIGLPKMNGYDLSRALRAAPATRHAILIAVTGWGQPGDRERAKEAGFDEHIVKPVDLDRLQSLLREV